jgi:uncharacterized cupin superfamily protein
VRPLDCVIHRPNEMEHTFVAGPDGLEYLVFGTRHPTEIGWLPRSRAIRFGWRWVEGRADDPWEVEATVGPLAVGEPSPRPANIVNVDEIEHETVRHQTFAYFTPEEKTKLAGLAWEKLPSGHRGSVPHCHSAEEEIFVIVEGAATLELWPPDGDVEETPLRPGHVVARPPGTRVPHSFRAGPEGVTMLVYGTRDPNDMAWYPRSRKIAWRGLGVFGRIETLDRLDGEPVEDD